MGNLQQDLRFGLRMLARSPGFTVVALLILAGGIGVSTTIFSLVNALLFSPLPYPEAERLVYLWESNPRARFAQAISYPNFLDWKNQNQVLEDMALLDGEEVNLRGSGEPERLQGIRVSSDFARLLGIRLAMGRSLSPEEFTPRSSHSVLLSYSLWQQRFGSNPEILHQTLTLNGEPHAVVGVLAADFKLGILAGFEPMFWAPLAPAEIPSRDARAFLALGRLKPGVTLERARADLALISRRLEQAHPGANSGWSAEVAPLRGAVDPIGYVLVVLLIGSILGIVATNVGSLLLARAARREKEIALRAALGASRPRVVRQLLTETMLLAAGGCGLGLLLGFGACRLINLMGAGTNLGLVEVRVDARVLVVAFLLALLTGIATGLTPALHMSRADLDHALKEGSAVSPSGPSRPALKSLLAITEVALSLVLLSTAGLILKSLSRLLDVDPGFRPQNVLTMSFSLSGEAYAQAQQRIAFVERLLHRLEGRADVRSAAVASALPTTGRDASFAIVGKPQPVAGEEPHARLTAVSPEYFVTLALPLKRGRAFAGQDGANALPVSIINSTAACKHWPGQDPIGAQITLEGVRRTIVGVVGDVRSAPLKLSPVAEIYVPLAQSPVGELALLVQITHDHPLGLTAAVKQEIRALDANQPVGRIQTLEKAIAADMGLIRTASSLLVGVALGALFLTAVGIYGVLALLATQRTREFGIRMALGARPWDVSKMIVRQGMMPVFLGAVPGLAVALAVARILSNRIYGLRPLEPAVLACATLMLAIVALVACYLPARRATRADPMVALRHE